MKKKSRLTLDMTSEEHAYLKMACAKMGVSMREFLLSSAFQKMEELEDEVLAKEAEEILKQIKSGKMKTISHEEMKKRLI